MRDLNSELDKMIEEHGSVRVLSALTIWLAEREGILVTQKKMSPQLFKVIRKDARFKP